MVLRNTTTGIHAIDCVTFYCRNLELWDCKFIRNGNCFQSMALFKNLFKKIKNKTVFKKDEYGLEEHYVRYTCHSLCDFLLYEFGIMGLQNNPKW